MRNPRDMRNELRKKAEEKLASLQERNLLHYLPKTDDTALIHEFQVHQIELEMQNEEMRLIQAELEGSRRRYMELYDFAPAGYLTMDQYGMIVEANFTAAALMKTPRAELIGRYLQSFMDQNGADAMHLFLRKSLKPGVKETLESRLLPAGEAPLEVTLNISGEYNRSDRLIRYRVILVDVSIMKSMERQSRAMENRLRALASELNLAEERTRKGLAVTLHDEVGQILAMARMKLSYARGRSAGEDLEETVDEVLEMLTEAMSRTRALISEISPPALHDLGLGDAIDSLAERMSSRCGIAFEVEKRGKFEDLEQDLKIMLYQIARELLVNVVKHSEGSRAVLTLRRDAHTVGIEVSDDGRGFAAEEMKPAVPGSGFGFFSIRERLKIYNGTLQVESAPGQGATVKIVLPLEKKRKRPERNGFTKNGG